MGVILWISLIILGGGAILLFYQDTKDKLVDLWLFVAFSTLLSLIILLYNPYNTVLNFASIENILKLVVILFYSIILLYFSQKNKIAIADIFFLLLILVLFPIKTSLIILILSTVLGLLCFIFKKDRHIGLVGILALISFFALLVQFVYRVYSR